MRAVVCTRYGPPDVLRLTELDTPVPKDNEVLVRIFASTVTAGDCELRRFEVAGWVWLPLRLYMGVFKPRIKVLGQEYAGVVEAVGKNVSGFKAGDDVFGPAKMNLGTHAEYICIPDGYAIVKKPPSISYAAAATIPTGGLNALHFLRKAKLEGGERVLIVGAGGSIGTYAVQIARAWGAEVDCVDSREKLDMLQSIGAAKVFDYARDSFWSDRQAYDVVIEVSGKMPLKRCLRILNPEGRLIVTNPRISSLFASLWINKTSEKRVLNALADYTAEDLDYLKKMIVDGKICPVIDREFSLEQTAEAHRYVEHGKKKGNIVIRLVRDDTN